MDRSHNVFLKLAFRAESGDASAQSELRRKLQPELIHIVRRVLRGGAGRSPMDQRILAEARRFGLTTDIAASLDGEALIQKVARSVSDLIEARRLKPTKAHAIDETVRG